ncbi:MAG: hypothetical protein IIV52_05265 [Alistipes sp.]|nr:hypothetical protein [Alistipes sp.]
MFRNIPYLTMTVVLLLLQIFVLDELSIALWIRPMLFPLIVMLLPMELRTIWVLLASLGVGVVMDVALGGAGLYTATLLPLVVLRHWVMYITTGRSVEFGDQSSLLSRLPLPQLMIYATAMLGLHHTMFFLLETLSFISPLRLIATIVLSTLMSVVVAWPILRLFLSKIVVK